MSSYNIDFCREIAGPINIHGHWSSHGSLVSIGQPFVTTRVVQ